MTQLNKVNKALERVRTSPYTRLVGLRGEIKGGTYILQAHFNKLGSDLFVYAYFFNGEYKSGMINYKGYMHNKKCVGSFLDSLLIGV